MRSLTARLVAASLALVVVALAAFGLATTLALRSYLMHRLDQDVVGPLHLAASPHPGPMGMRRDGPMDGPPDFVRGQRLGSLAAIIPDRGEPAGVILSGRHRADDRFLSARAVAELRHLPTDGTPQSIRISDLGTYRVAAVDLGPAVMVSGLPQSQVSDVIESVVRWELALGLIALAAAGVVGLGLVRRQLAPLREVAATAHEVAQLPLSEGSVRVVPRVASADDRTEVGRVGTALNTLLTHVETSLQARHRSEQQVRQFVADASHELRTPLATIRGYTELASAHGTDPAVLRESLAKVSTESLRMSALVDDLLLLARLDAGRALESTPVDLSRLAVEAVSDARLLAPDHRWALELTDAPVEVMGDERRLQQVLTNLLANARIHTPPGTQVTVTVAPGRLVVADNGPGFSDPDRALERFAQGDRSRSAQGDGAGLGLAIVDSIVRAHGGLVEITSAPGATSVTVEFG